MENSLEDITIGKYLQTIREKKNLTLEDIFEITKIRVRLLEKLESNLFDDLGGIGYAKAMILTYAKALGITENQIHELLQNQFNTKIQYAPISLSNQPRKFLLPTKIFSIMLLIIVIMLLSYLVINLYKDGVLTWPPFKKADAGMEIKPKEKTEKSLEIESKRIVPKSKKKDEMVLVEQVEKPKVNTIDDSTDHLNKLLFKDKKSPFNYDE
ncbi:MAG: helix-turn-helix domain-containing protein [Candidatus Cloacimonadota bacterium]|nr:helix-turn-helix domain-containing protein [Candidatus Cloacimonadota bacterium]